MKNVITSMLSFIFISLAFTAQAASVAFNPSEVELKILNGETAYTDLAVQGFSRTPYSLNFKVGSVLENSNIPLVWLSPVNISLFSRAGGTSATQLNLKVSVPPEAEAGIYTGMIVPENIRSSENISSRGVILSIEVSKAQTACTGPPVFTDVEIGPQNFWAPSNREVELEMSGILPSSPGCEIAAGYLIDSNDGTLEGDIILDMDGGFTEKIKINVSKKGQDKDGRIYNGTLFASDSEGNQANFDFFITVDHDRGQKVGLTQ